MTKEQAIELAKTGWWKDLPARDIVQFQLFERLLCMPFAEFHEAVEKALGRGVWTHEFAFIDGLKLEFLALPTRCRRAHRDKPAPTMQEILDLIPAEKRDRGGTVKNQNVATGEAHRLSPRAARALHWAIRRQLERMRQWRARLRRA